MFKVGTFFNIRKEDIPTSLVVFLVAVPLSLGIGIASGVSAESMIWLFGIGAVLITNLVTGLGLAVAFVLVLVLFSIDMPHLIKQVKADPKNLRILWRREVS